MGRLERHLDLGLIRRLAAGVKHKSEPAKRVKPPRKAASYRGAMRNKVLREDKTTWPNSATGRRLVGPRRYQIERFGKIETRPLTYKPNGKREIARRRIAKMAK